VKGRYRDDLPAAPLAAALSAYLSRNAPMEHAGKAVTRHVLLSIGIQQRSYYAWCVGKRTSVRFVVADRALTAMDLNWWDVWDPVEYPEVARQLGGTSDARSPTARFTV
jgi:hypothetical protein